MWSNRDEKFYCKVLSWWTCRGSNFNAVRWEMRVQNSYVIVCVMNILMFQWKSDHCWHLEVFYHVIWNFFNCRHVCTLIQMQGLQNTVQVKKQSFMKSYEGNPFDSLVQLSLQKHPSSSANKITNLVSVKMFGYEDLPDGFKLPSSFIIVQIDDLEYCTKITCDNPDVLENFENINWFETTRNRFFSQSHLLHWNECIWIQNQMWCSSKNVSKPCNHIPLIK